MPEKKQQPKQSEFESGKQGGPPTREDALASLPIKPALEPVAEPTPIGATRGPRPPVEPEPE